jgi:hypothetical protein
LGPHTTSGETDAFDVMQPFPKSRCHSCFEEEREFDRDAIDDEAKSTRTKTRIAEMTVLRDCANWPGFRRRGFHGRSPSR